MIDGLCEYYGEQLPAHAQEDLKLMSMTPMDMVTEFSKAFGHPLGKRKPDASDDMKVRLIEEEHTELLRALGEEFSLYGKGSAPVLKELADVVYVVYGYAAYRGWDLDEALRRVHVSNMSKLGMDGEPVYRADGKVMKGPNYQEPNLEDLV